MPFAALPVVGRSSKLILEYPVAPHPSYVTDAPLSGLSTNAKVPNAKDMKENIDLGHRHYSSLHWLYPGLFLPSIGNTEGNSSTVAKNRQKTNPLYIAALSLLAKKRGAGSDHTAWSAAWAACLSARLGNGNAAWKSLVKILDRYSVPNLLFLHPRLRANEVPTKFQEDDYKPNMRKRSCVSRGLKTLDKSPVRFQSSF